MSGKKDSWTRLENDFWRCRSGLIEFSSTTTPSNFAAASHLNLEQIILFLILVAIILFIKNSFFALSLSNQTLCEVLVFFRRAKNRLDGEKVWSQKSFCENNLWPKKNRTGQAEFGSSKVWPLVFSSAIKQRKNSGRGAEAQLVERPSKGPGSRVSVQLYWCEFESQLRHKVVGKNPSSAICWTSKEALWECEEEHNENIPDSLLDGWWVRFLDLTNDFSGVNSIWIECTHIALVWN